MVAGFDEEGAAVLQLADTVCRCFAGLFGYEGTVFVVVHVALPGLELEEPVGYDGLAVGGGEQGVAQAYDAAAGDGEVELHPVALGVDGAHFTFAACHHVNHLAREFFGHQHRELLHGLAFLAVYLAYDHLRLAHLQLVAFATHGLYEHREVHDAAAEDQQLVGRAGLFYAHGQVLLQLGIQAVAQVAAGDVFAFLAEERRGVDGEKHAHRGLVHLDGRQRLGIVGIANGVAYLKSHALVQLHQHGAYLARLHLLFGALFSKTFEGVEFLYLRLHLAAVAFHQGDGLARLQGAAVQPAHSYAAQIRAVVEARNHHLGVACLHLRLRYVRYDEVHQVGDVVGRGLPVFAHPPLLGTAIGGGELQLVVVSTEVEHQVEHSLLRPLGVAVGLVHLVHHHYGLQSQLYSLLEHKTRLGHGAFKGIHHQQHPVGHIQHTLHLAAEVAVTRRVDNVDLVAFIPHRHILRKNRNAAFAFQIVVVENKIARLLVVAEELRLMEHTVHEGGLAVVHMGYNCNVANLLHMSILLNYNNMYICVYDKKQRKDTKKNTIPE